VAEGSSVGTEVGDAGGAVESPPLHPTSQIPSEANATNATIFMPHSKGRADVSLDPKLIALNSKLKTQN
jgi:hypothetical protein